MESRRRDAAAMSTQAMGELEKRQRQRLREEAVQRRPGEFCYPLDSEEPTAAEEQQTPVNGNKRKMVGREEVEAKRRRSDKEAGVVVVKCSQEQGKGNQEQGKGKKETSFPSLKRKRIAERDEAEATKRISLSSSPVHDRGCSSSNGSSSRSHDRVCSSSRGQAAGDAARVSSLHSIRMPRGKRTHLKPSKIMCHQCGQRKEQNLVIKCSSCKKGAYCASCIYRLYPDMSRNMVAEACPGCRKRCNCIPCLTKSRKSKVSTSS